MSEKSEKTSAAEQQAALKVSPSDIAKLRHLYANLKNGGVRDTAQAKRIADGLLAPIIERLEQATDGTMHDVWHAMLAASPTPPALSAVQSHELDDDACRCEPSDYVRPPDYDGDGSVDAMARRAALAASPAEQQATKETSGGFHVWRDISTAPRVAKQLGANHD